MLFIDLEYSKCLKYDYYHILMEMMVYKGLGPFKLIKPIVSAQLFSSM